MAGFAAAVDDPLLAATAATAMLTVSADHAVLTTRGPGGFATALLDELSLLTPETLAAEVKLG
jgi:hydroxyethylthiazole kinase